MSESKSRSIFDWLTILAAWSGVGLGIWTAYVQYQSAQIRPVVEYGHWGTEYKLDNQERSQIHFRCILTNSGEAPAEDVRLKIWDVPEDAEIWSSLEHEIIERTDTTAVINVPLVPPNTNGFLTIRPFYDGGQKSMPYVPDVYYSGGRPKRAEWLNNFAKRQVFEFLSRQPRFDKGVTGWHRTWDDPVTEDDIERGSVYFTIEDR